MQAYHTVVTGDSGGGKTTLLREMQAEFPGLSIWVNFTNTDGITGRDLDDAATVRSVGEARASDATRLNWVTDSPLETARQARTVAHEYHEATGFPTQVIFDEAQNVLPDGEVDSDNPVKRMLHEDRDKALKVVIATQDPSDLDYTPIKQCKFWVWVGEWAVFHDGFLRYFSIPRDDLPTEPYQYVVFDKRMNVLHRAETQEAYA
ncbi:ATP-binding protein [Haloferax sp. ATB1]|uniref:ATP-binding protein n=1 Tax=Haloferax sp. ATB1 TaxID=1508454 RepID=UPI0005B209C3|nr:ATP-binding protein [Haloferax sp. ATB1]